MTVRSHRSITDLKPSSGSCFVVIFVSELLHLVNFQAPAFNKHIFILKYQLGQHCHAFLNTSKISIGLKIFFKSFSHPLKGLGNKFNQVWV